MSRLRIITLSVLAVAGVAYVTSSVQYQYRRWKNERYIQEYISVMTSETPTNVPPPVDTLHAQNAVPDIVGDLPPSTIRVGPYDFSVVYRSPADIPGDLGETFFDDNVIALRSTMTPGEMRETLLHEVFHACDMVGHTRPEAGSENPKIESVAPALLQVLRDNPKLLKWWLRRK